MGLKEEEEQVNTQRKHRAEGQNPINGKLKLLLYWKAKNYR